MYRNPSWQYIASPRNYYRTVQALKSEINSVRSSMVDLKQFEPPPPSSPNGKFNWLPCKDCDFPDNCVLAAENIAVARADHQGRKVPGKANYGMKYATIPVVHTEVAKLNYEVLISSPGQKFVWIAAMDGAVPARAVPGGTDLDGEEIYIGRAKIGFHVSCGKIKPSHKCAYLPLAGQSRVVKKYEVLCSFDS